MSFTKSLCQIFAICTPISKYGKKGILTLGISEWSIRNNNINMFMKLKFTIKNHAKVFDRVWSNKFDRFDLVVEKNNSGCSVECKSLTFVYIQLKII